MQNNYALGNAWFVKDYKIVEDADEEILAIREFDPATTAIVRKDDVNEIEGVSPGSGSIQLNSYLPNRLEYSYSSSTDQLAVFSEIFYDKGWNAYINGQKVPYIKVNYILRGMKVPAGQGEIVFAFEPATYQVGKVSTWISSVLILLLIVGVVYKEYTAVKEQ
jgi:uncharacterized membrane protein YfhO